MVLNHTTLSNIHETNGKVCDALANLGPARVDLADNGLEQVTIKPVGGQNNLGNVRGP